MNEQELDVVAVAAILDSWKPALQELLDKNGEGLDNLEPDQRSEVDQFVQAVVIQEEAQFRDIFLKFNNNKHGFARQYWQLLADLKRVMDGEGEYGLIYKLGFKGMTSEASAIANRMGIAAASWKLMVMKSFFERNWGEDIGKYKSSGSGCGTSTALVVVIILLTARALIA